MREKEKMRKVKKEEEEEDVEPESPAGQNEDSLHSFPDDLSDDTSVPVKGRGRGVRRDRKHKKLDAQALTLRRHKLWVVMAKKEVGRCQKSKASFRKEVLQNCKRMATGCMRVCRQKALQSQKTVKDKVWLLKRLTRTMQAEWKKFDRILKEQNRRAEKEAEEQRKMDKEILEVKRQQRKVNFLITLPELYAHFMKNKMGDASMDDEDTSTILKQLEDDSSLPASSSLTTDDYDCEAMKQQALKTAQEAYSLQQAKLNLFCGNQGGGGGGGLMGPGGMVGEVQEHDQPRCFQGVLKSYQLNGMNWLANLYYFGINGILADEMGLGKTVQSIAFLAHICEQYDTWGPFLIITPASTLHNWTGEIARFCPEFKVVPYWGNPEERKNLRKFFDGKNFVSKDASFHIVVTSYQIVIQDFKFLNRLKWNYMVLDEAQAIKSINSQRWKLLLGFSCRNRLLLSGTPIQNSMAELWALLHFIMPTLFDSHLWFNEWFSKDIEGHVENKTHVDEKHLNRLHMILKPFMLRRVKTEVENELTDKIEVRNKSIMMYCPLTLRQKFLYNGLKNKISIDELLRSSMGPSSQQSSVTTSLMNLVMQFRKVCNHPELLERREVRSAYTVRPQPYTLPKLVFRDAHLLHAPPQKYHILHNTLSIFHPHHIHCSLHASQGGSMMLLVAALQYAHILYLRHTWGGRGGAKRTPTTAKKHLLMLPPALAPLAPPALAASLVLRALVFASPTSAVYTHRDHTIRYIPETLNHRIMRSKKARKPMVEILSETTANDPDTTPAPSMTPLASLASTLDPRPSQRGPSTPSAAPPKSVAAPAKSAAAPRSSTAPRRVPQPPRRVRSPPEECSAPPKSAPPEEFHSPPEEFHSPPEEFHSPREEFHSPPEEFHSPQKSSTAPQKSSTAPQKSSTAPAKSSTAPQKSSTAPAKSSTAPAKSGSPQKTGGSHRSGVSKSHRKSGSSSSRHGSKRSAEKKEPIIGIPEGELGKSVGGDILLLPEIRHVPRPPRVLPCQPTSIPTFLLHTCPKAQCLEKELLVHDRTAAWWLLRQGQFDDTEAKTYVTHGSEELEKEWQERKWRLSGVSGGGGLRGAYPRLGWSHILIPDKHSLIMDAGKLYVLDTLLSQLKSGGHRVLIYSQMTKMIDLLEVSTLFCDLLFY
ncbi:Chromatin-remodeling ATPase INO80 [Chionoecetes opilio]|uniref:Chromatin-remodeling ATPase INO80 n=1 Tax=Chionoecetes opilio TaxID=41210 RepID=A0A8J4Y2U0_CHIOP|nr:Chromatin-remodeling ATPase INO80 [Chionoecetes opilio]